MPVVATKGFASDPQRGQAIKSRWLRQPTSELQPQPWGMARCLHGLCPARRRICLNREAMATTYSRLRGGVDAILQSISVLPIDLRYECISMLGFRLHIDIEPSIIQQHLTDEAVDTLFAKHPSERIAASFDCVIRDILLAEASFHSRRLEIAKQTLKGGLPRKLKKTQYLANQRLSCVMAAFNAWQEIRKECYQR